MNELWQSAVITGIDIALYVAPGAGKPTHKNRPFHGLVLHDSDAVREYYFDDGRVMRTEPNELFYLPKGSTYHVRSKRSGGCYAINFEADLTDEPFTVSLRNPESVLHHFKAAAEAWKHRDPLCTALAMRAVYDAICQLSREVRRPYVSGTQTALLAPAMEVIQSRFTENGINVADLAALCGISEVYFRRLFLSAYGVSPKEYVIGKRIEYAKTMLRSGDFSVSEVATLCGYAEPCHFSREFTKRTGVSPCRYGKQ